MTVRPGTVSFALRDGWAVPLALSLAVGPAAPLDAQTTTPDHHAGTRNVRSLLDSADALRRVPSRWHEAALLYQESAELLGPADPGAVRALRVSAQLLHSLGKVSVASATLERAGAVALSSGKLVVASECFLDAAFLARELRETARARRLARVARTLAMSRLFPRPEREDVLRRMRPSAWREPE